MYNLEYHVSKFNPDVIVGIIRGGLLPALHLSHTLDRPLMAITWQTRDTSKQEHNIDLQDMIHSGKRVVFVDDINDTGKTFLGIDQQYGCSIVTNVMMISLVAKTDSSFKARAALTIDDKRWVVFPYERD